MVCIDVHIYLFIFCQSHKQSRPNAQAKKTLDHDVVTFPENNYSSGVKVTFSNGRAMPDVTSADLTFSDRAEAALARAEESESWSEVEVRQAAKDHVMTTWSATRPSLEAYPVVVRTDGVYFYTSDGKKMIDFSSQAMCTNLGDSMPDEIMQAIIHQMKTAPMIWGTTLNSNDKIYKLPNFTNIILLPTTFFKLKVHYQWL